MWYLVDVEGWNYWENGVKVIELPFFTTIYHLFPLSVDVVMVLVWIVGKLI